jgi:hypothetical protein
VRPLALADAMSAFNSVILWSALPPPFRMHDVPTTYGLNVFILPDDTRQGGYNEITRLMGVPPTSEGR